jgi:hypothetical protein
VREITLIVAGVTLVFGVFASWLKYPRIELTIFNESSAAISDVHVRFMNGERTAKRIERGGLAFTEIESGGTAGVDISYRHSGGILRKVEPVYQSGDRGSQDRGFLKVCITDEGTKLVKSIYDVIDIPILTIHVAPNGEMTVK